MLASGTPCVNVFQVPLEVPLLLNFKHNNFTLNQKSNTKGHIQWAVLRLLNEINGKLFIGAFGGSMHITH